MIQESSQALLKDDIIKYYVLKTSKNVKINKCKQYKDCCRFAKSTNRYTTWIYLQSTNRYISFILQYKDWENQLALKSLINHTENQLQSLYDEANIIFNRDIKYHRERSNVFFRKFLQEYDLYNDNSTEKIKNIANLEDYKGKISTIFAFTIKKLNLTKGQAYTKMYISKTGFLIENNYKKFLSDYFSIETLERTIHLEKEIIQNIQKDNNNMVLNTLGTLLYQILEISGIIKKPGESKTQLSNQLIEYKIPELAELIISNIKKGLELDHRNNTFYLQKIVQNPQKPQIANPNLITIPKPDYVESSIKSDDNQVLSPNKDKFNEKMEEGDKSFRDKLQDDIFLEKIEEHDLDSQFADEVISYNIHKSNDAFGPKIWEWLVNLFELLEDRWDTLYDKIFKDEEKNKEDWNLIYKLKKIFQDPFPPFSKQKKRSRHINFKGSIQMFYSDQLTAEEEEELMISEDMFEALNEFLERNKGKFVDKLKKNVQSDHSHTQKDNNASNILNSDFLQHDEIRLFIEIRYCMIDPWEKTGTFKTKNLNEKFLTSLIPKKDQNKERTKNLPEEIEFLWQLREFFRALCISCHVFINSQRNDMAKFCAYVTRMEKYRTVITMLVEEFEFQDIYVNKSFHEVFEDYPRNPRFTTWRLASKMWYQLVQQPNFEHLILTFSNQTKYIKVAAYETYNTGDFRVPILGMELVKNSQIVSNADKSLFSNLVKELDSLTNTNRDEEGSQEVLHFLSNFADSVFEYSSNEYSINFVNSSEVVTNPNFIRLEKAFQLPTQEHMLKQIDQKDSKKNISNLINSDLYLISKIQINRSYRDYVANIKKFVYDKMKEDDEAINDEKEKKYSLDNMREEFIMEEKSLDFGNKKKLDNPNMDLESLPNSLVDNQDSVPISSDIQKSESNTCTNPNILEDQKDDNLFVENSLGDQMLYGENTDGKNPKVKISELFDKDEVTPLESELNIIKSSSNIEKKNSKYSNFQKVNTDLFYLKDVLIAFYDKVALSLSCIDDNVESVMSNPTFLIDAIYLKAPDNSTSRTKKEDYEVFKNDPAWNDYHSTPIEFWDFDKNISHEQLEKKSLEIHKKKNQKDNKIQEEKKQEPDPNQILQFSTLRGYARPDNGMNEANSDVNTEEEFLDLDNIQIFHLPWIEEIITSKEEFYNKQFGIAKKKRNAIFQQIVQYESYTEIDNTNNVEKMIQNSLNRKNFSNNLLKKILMKRNRNERWIALRN